MNKLKKPHNLSIKGIDEKLFSDSFYMKKCAKIDFKGVIKEYKITTEKDTDYIALVPKFKPHSDYELMLQSTDSVVKSAITSLTDQALHKVFNIGYDYIDFLSQPEIIEKYELHNGYPYLVYNYDEFTTDRHSGMSKKPFHLHLNFWTSNTINSIKPIDEEKESSFYYKSVVDPIFDVTQTLTRDALAGPELASYIEPSKINNEKIYYSSVYKVKNGWQQLQNEEMITMLKTIHHKLETRYIEILKCFCGQDELPELYTRHELLPKDTIVNNVLATNMQNSTKEILIQLADKLRTINSEQFHKISEKKALRDTLISLRWLAYSIGLFSNNYVQEEKPYTQNDLYINVTPRLFTKIGGASIMNFPDCPHLKIDRGVGNISEQDFVKRLSFQKDFYSFMNRERRTKYAVRNK